MSDPRHNTLVSWVMASMRDRLDLTVPLGIHFPSILGVACARLSPSCTWWVMVG